MKTNKLLAALVLVLAIGAPIAVIVGDTKVPQSTTPTGAYEPDDGFWRNTMTNSSTLSGPELDDRIAILRDNIRQLTEQAAGSSGAADEERTAERIAQQTEELEALVKQRDAAGKK